MKLEISVNFDFGELAGKTKNIIYDYTSGYTTNITSINNSQGW